MSRAKKEQKEVKPQPTPGDWEIRRRKNGSIGITGGYHTLNGLPAVMGGFLHVCDLSGDEHHDEANAHLIIAAKDLRRAAELGFELSSWAAAANEKANSQEWLAGLRERIGAFEVAYTKAMRKVDGRDK